MWPIFRYGSIHVAVMEGYATSDAEFDSELESDTETELTAWLDHLNQYSQVSDPFYVSYNMNTLLKEDICLKNQCLLPFHRAVTILLCFDSIRFDTYSSQFDTKRF